MVAEGAAEAIGRALRGFLDTFNLLFEIDVMPHVANNICLPTFGAGAKIVAMIFFQICERLECVLLLKERNFNKYSILVTLVHGEVRLR